MKIMVALDHNSYSIHALTQAAWLASNTWADIMLCGVLDSKSDAGMQHSLNRLLAGYTHRFLNGLPPDRIPYVLPDSDELNPDTLLQKLDAAGEIKIRGDKQLHVIACKGNPVKVILEQAEQSESDLIILGGDTENQCRWDNGANVPYGVAMDANCPVLVMKKPVPDIHRVLACLDHDFITQSSLEMVSQMCTSFNAALDIVGLARKGAVKLKVQEIFDGLLRYYRSKQIQPWLELVDLPFLDDYVSRPDQWALIALWMGKQSIFKQVFSASNVSRLLKNSDASVLLLR